MWEKIKKITPDTWARTICLLIALVNQCLAIFGKQALPFAENDIYQVVSILATIVTGAVAWWKNNSFTTVAQTADTVMKQMKVGQLDTGSLQPILNRVPVDAQADPPSKTGDAGSKADGIPAAEPAASGTADGEEKPAAAGAAAGEAEITVAGADSGTMEEAVSSLEANRPAVDVSPVLPAADHTAAEADERLSDAAGLTDESSAASSISDRSASDPF